MILINRQQATSDKKVLKKPGDNSVHSVHESAALPSELRRPSMTYRLCVAHLYPILHPPARQEATDSGKKSYGASDDGAAKVPTSARPGILSAQANSQ